jgi:hypothetical protein
MQDETIIFGFIVLIGLFVLIYIKQNAIGRTLRDKSTDDKIWKYYPIIIGIYTLVEVNDFLRSKILVSKSVALICLAGLVILVYKSFKKTLIIPKVSKQIDLITKILLAIILLVPIINYLLHK